MAHSAGTPSSFSRSLVGLAASVFATIPLAISFSLHGFFSSPEQHSVIGIVLGTALVVIVALTISAASGLVFGIPVYILAARTNAPRLVVLTVTAALAGVIVHELWHGGELFEDVGSTLLFAFFGAYSGAALWYGADIWPRT
jgi:hypothetical protein